MAKKYDRVGSTVGVFRILRLVNDGEANLKYEVTCTLCGRDRVMYWASILRSKSCGCVRSRPPVYTAGPADLTGLEFGTLTVLERVENNRFAQHQYRVRCGNCGREKVMIRGPIIRAKSCRCVTTAQRVVISERNSTHGYAKDGTKTWEYRTWTGIKNRCLNKSEKNKDYQKYGARGVTVCSRWRMSFQAFLTDINEHPRPSPSHTVDRPDNDGGYWCGKTECPECGPLGRHPNWRWATRKEQAQNRRSTRLLTHDGQTLTAAEWADKIGLPRGVIYGRIAAGWDDVRVLTAPVRRTNRDRISS